MNEMAFRVTSNDGTTIAYDRKGSGPAVVLVGGGLDDGAENAPLVPALAEHFTVYNYARRGRGASGFTEPYAVEREIEDLDALIAEAGGSAHLFGASSGGALALEAAAAGSAIDTIAVWEVPRHLGFFFLVALVGAALRTKSDIAAQRIGLLERSQRLEREIVNISETEQRRIGQDLHDGLCQYLARLTCSATSLRDDLQELMLQASW